MSKPTADKTRDKIVANIIAKLPRGSTVVHGRFLVGVTRKGVGHVVSDPVDATIGSDGSPRLADMVSEARSHGATRFVVYAAACLHAVSEMSTWRFEQIGAA